MCYVIRKYSRASDDRSFEGPLIRVPTSAEEFTQIAQLHIILIYFLHTYPIQDSVRYSGILLGSYRTAFQKYISMIFYLNKFLPPNFTSTCSRITYNHRFSVEPAIRVHQSPLLQVLCPLSPILRKQCRAHCIVPHKKANSALPCTIQQQLWPRQPEMSCAEPMPEVLICICWCSSGCITKSSYIGDCQNTAHHG